MKKLSDNLYQQLINSASHFSHQEDSEGDVVKLFWGKYGYGVSESAQEDDYANLQVAISKFNNADHGFYAFLSFADKFTELKVFDYKTLSKDDYYYDLIYRRDLSIFNKIKLLGYSNNKVDDLILRKESERNEEKEFALKISQLVNEEVSEKYIKYLKQDLVSSRLDYSSQIGCLLLMVDGKSFSFDYDQIDSFFSFLTSDEVLNLFRYYDKRSLDILLYFKKGYVKFEWRYSNFIVFCENIDNVSPEDIGKVYSKAIDKFIKVYKAVI